MVKIDTKKMVVVTFIVILSLSLLMRYKPYGYKIEHEYPASIKSADANSRVSEAEWFVESKQSYYQPKWFDDNYTNILVVEPPLSGTLAALLSQISGIPAYDLLYFVAVISGVGVAICFFLLFWKIFKNIYIGILAALLLLYPFEDFYNYLIEIGMYPHFTQLVFLVLILIFFFKFLDDKKGSSLLGIAVMFAFAFYSHSPIVLYLLLFIVLVLIYRIFRKEISITKVFSLLFIALILIVPYLPVLLGNYLGVITPASNTISSSIDLSKIFVNRERDHPIQINNFVTPLIYILVIAGVVGSLFLLKDKQYRIIVLLFLFFFILTIVSSYFGIRHDHVNIKPRYMLYVFAYPIAATGIYALVLLLNKYVRFDYKIALTAIAVLIIIFQINNFTKVSGDSFSIINQNSYNAYLWARRNIPEQKRILCIGCYQFEGLYTHHPTYIPSYEVDSNTVNQLIDVAQNNKTEGTIKTISMGHSDWRLYWDGLKLSSYGLKENKDRDICEFDYFVLKEFRELTPVISAIGNKLIAKNNSVVYNQNNVVIIKNNKVDGECI